MGNRNLYRLCGDGILVAIYCVLSILTIRITPNLQITFTGLVILIACVLYGPWDAILIALIGSFISQLRSVYGLTITTPLWMIPPVLRAAAFGIAYELFFIKGVRLEEKKVLYFILSVLAGLIVTIANTAAIFLDAMILGYPAAFAWLETLFRFLSSIGSSVACALLSLPVIYALQKTGFVRERNKKKPTAE